MFEDGTACRQSSATTTYRAQSPRRQLQYLLCPTRAVGCFTKGLSLEQSLDKEGAIATLERLRVENPDGVALKSYFDDRGDVIDELFGGRVSFQVRWETRRVEDFNTPQPLISRFAL